MNTKKRGWGLRKQAPSKQFFNLEKKYFLTIIVAKKGGKN